MQTLNAQTVALQGINLIEASAGTGKTWTISWLYLRLIAVEGLKVNQVLVVTYTEAATAELRDRIRRRLVEALAFLEKRPCPENYSALLNEVSHKQACERLQLALVSFDEAAVFTIHGFCKRMLMDNAFEASLPFEQQLLANEDDLLTELTDQFWYQHFLHPDVLHLALLQKYKLTPDKLLASVKNFIGKVYLKTAPAFNAASDYAATQDALAQAAAACATCWATEQAHVLAAITGGLIDARTYSKRHLPNWTDKLVKTLAQPVLLAEHVEAVERFSTTKLLAAAKDGKIIPQHTFFTLVDEWLALHQQVTACQTAALEKLRLRLLQFLRRQLPQRKQQLGVLTFDDLLLRLQSALQHHPILAQRLADQYQAALIDEFQDTDPIQYAIFSHIYQQNTAARVFFVGDPKQAIYGFRGADIHTYLQAANDTDSHGTQYTLGRNFRSHPQLLQALNHLFAQSDNPFLSEIAYIPVEAGKPQADFWLNSAEMPQPALRWWDWASLEQHPVSQVEDNIAQAVADDIAKLLNTAQQGQAGIGERALESRDIAVLVRTSKQGEKMKQALLQRGIASVQKTRESIFCTREADELRVLLRAVAEPGNEAALRQALATELMGFSASQLLHLDENPAALEQALEAFHRWHTVWQQQGFMPMFRSFMQQRQRYAHLLALADGERRLTNLLHLAELIHTDDQLQGHGMHTVIRWLQRRADAASEAEETHQLRLESDENLVQIVTIHKSKGLEYGVVYCPYLWKESEREAEWFSDFDTAQHANFLQAKSLADDTVKARYRQAMRAENLRLLYVALTRAKYQCTVVLVTGKIEEFQYYSALVWLLFGKLPDYAQIASKLLKSTMPIEQRQTLMQAQLHDIVTTADGTMVHEIMTLADTPQRYVPLQTAALGQARQYTHQLPLVPKVGSFSGLTSGKHDEKPDHDTGVFQWPSASVLPDPERDAFPRGAQAGSCLHKMLEKLDFTQALTEQHQIIVDALAQHGLAASWLNAAQQLLDATLRTPLTHGMALNTLTKTQRLDELEFFFPVGQLRLAALQALLHRHLPAEWVAIHAAIDQLKFATLTGYMKGFIDLIFYQDGRYYIVDYKSNDLGTYTQQTLHQAMADHHYYLQYVIYSLALHRYLRQRVRDYQWETHVGGVMYLFLRGMQPQQAASGVFFHQPSVALIHAVDDLFTVP